MATLNKFKKFFDGKSLEKGTNILLLWKTEGVLDVVAKTHPDSQDYSKACAHLGLVLRACSICSVQAHVHAVTGRRIQHSSFCKASGLCMHLVLSFTVWLLNQMCCMSFRRAADKLADSASGNCSTESSIMSCDVSLHEGNFLQQVKPDLTIESPGLCRALFEVYTGSNTVVPEAKKSWAEGARQLIDSDEVSRKSRKGGGG